MAFNELRALAFVDAGHVRVIDPITETSKYGLSSVGLGLRAKGNNGLQAALWWAYPLKALGNTARGDHRLHFSLAYEW